MKQNIEFTVKPELLGAIGNLWDGELSELSPFKYGKTSSITNEHKTELKKIGICDNNGKITDKVKPAIEVLANARAFTRIYIHNGLNIFEYISYFNADGNAASVTNDSGDQLINYPAPNNGILENIRQNIGETIYRNSDFECDIKSSEALVLAAMMDIQRKTFMSDIVDEKETGAISMDIGRIQSMLSGNAKNYQWLTYIIRDMMEGKAFNSSEKIEPVLDSLVKIGYVTRHNGGYRLTQDTLLLSRRMLLLDTFLTLTSGRIGRDGKVVIVGFTGIQSGVHDLLFIDANKDSILIDAVSSAVMLDYVSHFLEPSGALEGKNKSC
ncbi:MAG: hypothetical protein M8353_10350 [ANME-2 cluster archaeon]|nr:hypothetical protein [ANME-2 cluster archaeon]